MQPSDRTSNISTITLFRSQQYSVSRFQNFVFSSVKFQSPKNVLAHFFKIPLQIIFFNKPVYFFKKNSALYRIVLVKFFMLSDCLSAGSVQKMINMQNIHVQIILFLFCLSCYLPVVFYQCIRLRYLITLMWGAFFWCVRT